MFIQICVGAIICLALAAGSLLLGGYFSIVVQDKDPAVLFSVAWVASTIGFSICLTVILFSKGVI